MFGTSVESYLSTTLPKGQTPYLTLKNPRLLHFLTLTVQEGVHLYAQGYSPYDGGVYHQVRHPKHTKSNLSFTI